MPRSLDFLQLGPERIGITAQVRAASIRIHLAVDGQLDEPIEV